MKLFNLRIGRQIRELNRLRHIAEILVRNGLGAMLDQLEFGRFHGEVVLGDEFSPDGCRLWDATTRNKLDKDRFRQGLGGVVEAYEEVARRLGVPI